jgi:hypothetical protein
VNTLSLARLNELAGRAIPYAKATGAQRSLWRVAMLGEDRADLPEWQLEADERASLRGEVLDERFFRFQEEHGFSLFKPLISPKRQPR